MNSKNSGNCCPSRAPAPSITGKPPLFRSTPAASATNSSNRDFVEKSAEKRDPHLTCPVCRQSLRETNLVRVAVKNDGSREPMGSMDCHRR